MEFSPGTKCQHSKGFGFWSPSDFRYLCVACSACHLQLSWVPWPWYFYYCFIEKTKLAFLVMTEQGTDLICLSGSEIPCFGFCFVLLFLVQLIYLWISWCHFFDGWVILHCVNLPHILYLFFCWGTSRLFPVSGYYEQTNNGHGWASVFVVEWNILGVYA